ncbi:hypothetical protein MCOR34_004727 [Pyricularia oryzae]|uniref:Uncharacterized protein n=1 Tax=Pyricularia oryzae TaxID=318829 RepID=A0A4P7NCX6_PYROR|nr:hypothetical protein MCOR34_004727 [Pyricularia oryzae]KAI6477878.1 hypothetical protein MCOR17_000370 [Pyricularia oryzae]KAI6600462.1 hypothetical protein MCOR04_002285 [Pyricularia oryzae]QBZ58660.1 hypothetical protein PoMZ_03618 [Pyricularia oryzae]
MSLSPVTVSRPPHSGRWPRTARLVWREREETSDDGEALLVWDEVWTRPSRKFGRSKEGRLRQVAEIPALAPHFPRLLKANRINGVLTLARPAYRRRALLSELDAATLRRLKADLKAVFSALYDHAIAYVFTPDGFEVVSRCRPWERRPSSSSSESESGESTCTEASGETEDGAAATAAAVAPAEWSIYIDGWNHATRHKVRDPGSKKTAYFSEMEAEQLQRIDEYFAPFETRAKTSIFALLNHD